MNYQYHLSAKNCSGRGVRVRMLSPDECDRVALNAAKEGGESITVIQFERTKEREGVKAMITAVTKQAGLSAEAIMSAEWMDVTPTVLEDDYAKLFNAKDDVLLRNMYREFHEATNADVEAIMGKALPVAVP